jgi:hypothetical protein
MSPRTASSGPSPPGCAKDRGEAFGPMHAVHHALLLGRWGGQLTDTMVGIVFAPLGR